MGGEKLKGMGRMSIYRGECTLEFIVFYGDELQTKL